MMNPLTCPHCGRINTEHSGVTSPEPTPDDSAALCYKCGRWSIFTSSMYGLALRLPTAEETEQLAHEQDAMTALAAWRENVQGRPDVVRARPHELVSITRARLKP